MESYFGHVWLVRLLFQRALAAIYLIAFLAVLFQFRALLGERGLLPVPAFVKRLRFRDAPSIFHWRYSDRLAAPHALAAIARQTRQSLWRSRSSGSVDHTGLGEIPGLSTLSG